MINISENEKNKVLSKQKNAENKAVLLTIENQIPYNVPVTRWNVQKVGEYPWKEAQKDRKEGNEVNYVKKMALDN